MDEILDNNQPNMHWFQLHIHCSAEQVSALEAYHQSLGAVAITLRDQADEAIFEPKPGETPIWPQAILTALYPANQSPESILDQLIIDETANIVTDYEVEWLADKAWEREWLQHFEPLDIAEKLLILPSYPNPCPPDHHPHTANMQARTVLHLDPGLAFGTGSHATTRLCLEWLCQTIKPDHCVLDFGCGSGILAISAALLGATHITAVDIDPQALLATQQNADKNSVAEHIHLCTPHEIEHHAHQYDIIVANILAQPLCELAPKLMRYLKNPGALALSGILVSQCESVIEAYSPICSLQFIAQKEDWVLLSGSI